MVAAITKQSPSLSPYAGPPAFDMSKRQKSRESAPSANPRSTGRSENLLVLERLSTLSPGCRKFLVKALHPAIATKEISHTGLSTGLMDNTDPTARAGNTYFKIKENRKSGALQVTYTPKGVETVRHWRLSQQGFGAGSDNPFQVEKRAAEDPEGNAVFAFTKNPPGSPQAYSLV
jgi:hypothetical protein